jgi:hypothetical protein
VALCVCFGGVWHFVFVLVVCGTLCFVWCQTRLDIDDTGVWHFVLVWWWTTMWLGERGGQDDRLRPRCGPAYVCVGANQAWT